MSSTGKTVKSPAGIAMIYEFVVDDGDGSKTQSVDPCHL